MSKEAQPHNNRTPRTEEEIHTYTIGEPKPLSRRILIVDYDPHWLELFAREAERIRSVLGSGHCRLSMAARRPCQGWPRNRSSICCWWSLTRRRKMRTRRPWK